MGGQAHMGGARRTWGRARRACPEEGGVACGRVDVWSVGVVLAVRQEARDTRGVLAVRCGSHLRR